ncbi:MAG TPA: type II toxin-antitoxin system Phd/YefM family antitoxin [Candidatus Sericytochromatia bacterium]
MQHYSLTDARNKHGEVFDLAAVEPVLLTKQSRPSHVIMSAKAYQQLMEKLAELEDQLLSQEAEKALNQSQMVGVEKFTLTLKQIANGEA